MSQEYVYGSRGQVIGYLHKRKGEISNELMIKYKYSPLYYPKFRLLTSYKAIYELT